MTDTELNAWERLPIIVDILTSREFGAWLHRRDKNKEQHGKWELAEDGWFCTACKLYAPFDCDPEEKGIPLCPWCGASMWKEVE